MNQYNNKDLYQIIGLNKNASQQQIIKVSQDLIPKNPNEPVQISREIDEAIMVLTDPQKKIEYDEYGWKDEWRNEAEKRRAFRHSIFEAIQNYKHHYGNTYALKPDGFRVYVWPDKHLEPNLWAPTECWVSKIWDIRGPNWKQELEDFKNKMIAALDEAWEREKKTPLLGDCWEAVEDGNCANCGKDAKLRWKGKHSDGKVYCSQECHWENEYKVPKYELEKIKYEIPELEKPKLAKYKCVGCHYEGYDCYERDDGSFRCKACFNKELEKLRNSFKDGNKEYEGNEKCDYCGNKIKYEREGNTHHFKEGGIGSVDNEGNHYTFCSQECFKKGMKGKGKWVVRKNAFAELLKWMEKEGIINIRLDLDNRKLVLEYGKNNSKTIEDDNLTPEQREIKNFLQQIGKNSLSQNEARAEVEGKNNNKWVKPVVIGGIAVLFITLIGIIIYKSRKKGYQY